MTESKIDHSCSSYWGGSILGRCIDLSDTAEPMWIASSEEELQHDVVGTTNYIVCWSDFSIEYASAIAVEAKYRICG